MSDFKRKHHRYIVIKSSDLTGRRYDQLTAYLSEEEIPTRTCVVVEEDWEIYEEVWSMIEQMTQDEEKQ